MSQNRESPVGDYPSNSALGAHLRVKVASGYLALCGADEVGVGTLDVHTLSTDSRGSVREWGAPGTRKCVASEAISQYAEVYGAAAGKVSDTKSQNFIGIALEEASADGNVIEVLEIPRKHVPIIAAAQALSGAGAIALTSEVTKWTTTAADAATLADGTFVGQRKKVHLIVDGGDGTLTPTNLAGGTTITFADAGDFAELRWDGTEWVAVELGNDADGATGPVLA